MQLLAYLLGVIMFEECKNQWSASRPLLGLVILQPSRYQEVVCCFPLNVNSSPVRSLPLASFADDQARQQLISSLPPHKQLNVATCFDALMDGAIKNISPLIESGVENSLSSKNRDRFTQNLGVFRREINPLTATGAAPSPTSPPASPLGMN